MTILDALQTALAAEHAAVYVYGTLGAHTSLSSTPGLYDAVSAAYAVHRSRRDQLTSRVLDHGGEPVAAEPAYTLPPGLGTAVGVTTAALELERRCATTYAWLVAQTVEDDRAWAIAALTSTAVRELSFRGSPEIFPGAAAADR
jgi:hypothetical protein